MSVSTCSGFFFTLFLVGTSVLPELVSTITGHYQILANIFWEVIQNILGVKVKVILKCGDLQSFFVWQI